MKKTPKITLRDPNAQAMWKKNKSVVYKDKTKYSRKEKHKKSNFDY